MNPVKKLRTSLGLSQEDFCMEVEVDRPHLSRIENNHHDMGLLKFLAWCKIFNVNPVEIFKD